MASDRVYAAGVVVSAPGSAKDRQFWGLSAAVSVALIADIVLMIFGFAYYGTLGSMAAFAVSFVMTVSALVIDLPSLFAFAMPAGFPGKGGFTSAMAAAWLAVGFLVAAIVLKIIGFVYADTTTALVLFIIALIAVGLALLAHLFNMCVRPVNLA